MKTAEDMLPYGSDFSGDGGCGDFTDMCDRKEAIIGAVEHTKLAIDEIIIMCDKDIDNPVVWQLKNKILAFKETIK